MGVVVRPFKLEPMSPIKTVTGNYSCQSRCQTKYGGELVGVAGQLHGIRLFLWVYPARIKDHVLIIQDTKKQSRECKASC